MDFQEIIAGTVGKENTFGTVVGRVKPDSIYLQDPNGLKIELACYKFEPPAGFRAVDVLIKAHRLRVERGDHHIAEAHLADAIESLMAMRDRLPA